jgi:hypothetical protein
LRLVIYKVVSTPHSIPLAKALSFEKLCDAVGLLDFVIFQWC